MCVFNISITKPCDLILLILLRYQLRGHSDLLGWTWVPLKDVFIIGCSLKNKIINSLNP